MRRFLIHVYHGGENIAFSDLLLHKGYCLGEIGLNIFSFPACEELRAGCDKGIYKHGTVFSRFAACRFNPAAYFLPVFLLWLDDMKVILAPCRVYIGIAGVLLFCALMVRLQRSRWSRLVFGES